MKTQLIDNPEALLKRHPGVPAGRAMELLGFLQHTDPHGHAATYKVFRDSLPPAELDLVAQLLGLQPIPAPEPVSGGQKPTPKTNTGKSSNKKDIDHE